LFAALFIAAGCDEYEYDELIPDECAQGVVDPSEKIPEPVLIKNAAFDVVEAMGVGWCLGNTLDCINNKKTGLNNELANITPEEFYETYWGNPVTTEEMIKAVAEAGFGAVRIPVTYSDHMDDNYVIRAEWLERVRQIVDYALDNGLYCIINLHHDTGHGSWPWLKADLNGIEHLGDRFRAVWLQIAEFFIEYDEKLLFESFNEILDTDDRWDGADPSAYHAVNLLNQIFLDAVRETGGKNENRFLIVKTYAAGVSKNIIEAFTLPEDGAEGRLIVGAHLYGSLPFAWTQNNVNWATAYDDWDPVRDGRPVEEHLGALYERFIKNGIPVIIGEFGAQNKNNTRDRIEYAVHYVETAARYGITCFWWDDGGQFKSADEVGNFALLERNNARWFFPEIVEAMVKAANGR